MIGCYEVLVALKDGDWHCRRHIEWQTVDYPRGRPATGFMDWLSVFSYRVTDRSRLIRQLDHVLVRLAREGSIAISCAPQNLPSSSGSDTFLLLPEGREYLKELEELFQTRPRRWWPRKRALA